MAWKSEVTEFSSGRRFVRVVKPEVVTKITEVSLSAGWHSNKMTDEAAWPIDNCKDDTCEEDSRNLDAQWWVLKKLFSLRKEILKLWYIIFCKHQLSVQTQWSK